jgi:uncharacterized protein (TIGR00661 family)
MRILFTIQGQGRGHLTQAIATGEILQAAGHDLVEVVAGSHPGRPLPSSFIDAFAAPVTVLPSPGFVFRKNRGVDMPGTLLHAVRHGGEWRGSLRRLSDIIDRSKPDLVLNFFEPLTGLLQAARPARMPVLAAAHQFALLGPKAGAPPGSPVAPAWLKAFIRFVSYRSWKLALSFTPGESAVTSIKRVVVAPPLLRRRVLSLDPRRGDYVLVYVATHGYADAVRAWHEVHPAVRLHCFYDRPGAPVVETVGPNLTFHQLDADKFLDFMAGCRAVVCTAGFESICEAAFLGKPVLMIPLENHLEQELNARDGASAGVAVSHPCFDLDALSRVPDQVDTAWFREWCLQAEPRLLEIVERVVRNGAVSRT